MNAAIAIDAWKLSIFERNLTQAGYEYEKISGVARDTLLLIVKTTDAKALGVIVRAANDEADMSRSTIH